jgi:hypothetical protein
VFYYYYYYYILFCILFPSCYIFINATQITSFFSTLQLFSDNGFSDNGISLFNRIPRPRTSMFGCFFSCQRSLCVPVKEYLARKKVCSLDMLFMTQLKIMRVVSMSLNPFRFYFACFLFLSFFSSLT